MGSRGWDPGIGEGNRSGVAYLQSEDHDASNVDYFLNLRGYDEISGKIGFGILGEIGLTGMRSSILRDLMMRSERDQGIIFVGYFLSKSGRGLFGFGICGIRNLRGGGVLGFYRFQNRILAVFESKEIFFSFFVRLGLMDKYFEEIFQETQGRIKRRVRIHQILPLVTLNHNLWI
ncbi:hypothetical protein HA466_0031620 [Hirschfeldia incana]|nr:hypothetical protein HA466_0031620 [Hirschfeldia incana]